MGLRVAEEFNMCLVAEGAGGMNFLEQGIIDRPWSGINRASRLLYGEPKICGLATLLIQ